MVDMIARIRGLNETKPAFDAVARDAQAAAQKVAASGQVAATGLRAEGAALAVVERSSRMAAMQQKNLLFQLNDIGVSLAGGMNPLMVLAQQGSQIATIYGPEEGGLGQAFKETGNLAVSMVTKFWPIVAVVAAVSVGFAGLTSKINETAETQVSFGNVVTATMQLAAESIGRFFKPAIDQLGNWFTSFVDWIAPTFRNAVNFVVGFFAQGAQHIQVAWALLPNAIGEVAINAMNNVLAAITDGLNKNRAQVVAFLAQLSTMGGPLGAGFSMGAQALAGTGDISLGQIANPFAGTGKLIAGNTDYAGIAFDAISNRAQKLALASKTAEDAAKGLGHTLKGPLTDGIDQLTAKTNDWVEAARGAFSNLGSTIVGAFTKGGNVVNNLLDALIQKVGQFGENLLNSTLNKGLDALLGGLVSAVTPTGGAFGNGLWGSAIFAGVHHAGGVAGNPNVGRMVSPSLFVNAPRYHSGGIAGMRADEVPAILQRGERVIPRGQSSGGGNAVNITNHYTVSGTLRDRDVAAMIQRERVQTVEHVKRALPGWQVMLQRDGAI